MNEANNCFNTFSFLSFSFNLENIDLNLSLLNAPIKAKEVILNPIRIAIIVKNSELFSLTFDKVSVIEVNDKKVIRKLNNANKLGTIISKKTLFRLKPSEYDPHIKAESDCLLLIGRILVPACDFPVNSRFHIRVFTYRNNIWCSFFTFKRVFIINNCSHSVEYVFH
jgi:hypothetical protein